jgi:hypothetical protein
VPAEVRGLAREHTTEAIERLVFWMKSKDPRASVAAAVMTRRINLTDSELVLLEQRLLTIAEQPNAKH